MTPVRTSLIQTTLMPASLIPMPAIRMAVGPVSSRLADTTQFLEAVARPQPSFPAQPLQAANTRREGAWALQSSTKGLGCWVSPRPASRRHPAAAAQAT